MENRPDGLYGEVMDRATGANTRFATRPHQETTQWEMRAIDAALLLEELNEKYAK